MTKPPMHIIGFVGYQQSGKDTAALGVIKNLNTPFTKVGMADPLREMARILNPVLRPDSITGDHETYNRIVDENGYEEAKRRYPEVRQFLQLLGTDAVRTIIGPDSWPRAWQRKVDGLPGHIRGVVVPDVRFQNEAHFLKSKGAYLIRIIRAGQVKPEDDHASEAEVDFIDTDMSIENNGSVGDLHRAVNRMLWQWGIA